ncbi:hypothetical protein T265_05124 [Opisthorchis viverrini]|uniref:RRM domain-containing protein n=1 Tax=Opisthorchis viverrini TaxID=6198 RepID=A0A075AFM4_OPIVI|nr:hypothetical protein T265_05124 [Opisthorchis viverrini]KER27919.1 hypothetical protein T265_05124 [Opisthorchis viverrini]
MVRTRPLPLDFPCPGLSNLAVFQPSCFLRVAWQLGSGRVLQLNGSFKMHQMYQKACEFYERAAAKVVSALNELTASCSSKTAAVRRPGDSNATHYPIVPSGDPNASSKSSEAHVPPHTPRSENIPPPAPALSADRSNYSLAYAAAYKQTVGTIPPPENGGPAPNTPEYSALWQRYMDYYLRYYMQAYASMVPNGPSKPGAAINPPETATISPTKTSVSGEEEKPVPPKASQTKEDENSSASKRPKLSEKVNSEASVKTDNEKQDTASDVKVYAQTTQPAEQPTTEAPKATAPPSSDDIKSSKCIWISNLPQGVKAVDVKERCTPFGRVQTIKIIGSRKSTPPSIYAYLVMESVESATRLVEGLQGAKFDNQEIKVKRTIKIIGSRKSTPPSIYAYLVMESVESATRLVEGLQGAKFDNQEIKVKRRAFRFGETLCLIRGGAERCGPDVTPTCVNFAFCCNVDGFISIPAVFLYNQSEDKNYRCFWSSRKH